MTPRGILAYLAGLVLLLLGCGLAGIVVLLSFAQPAWLHRAGAVLLLACALVIFGALHLLGAGLYRMLVHLYHTISRTDPAGDRRLRGRTLYLLGQLATAMTVPTTVLFVALAVSEAAPQNRDVGLTLLVLPAGFFLTVSLLALLGGLGIMVRDMFLRNRDIVEKREAERRRRLEEVNEPQTEVIPPTADELREHIREDR